MGQEREFPWLAFLLVLDRVADTDELGRRSQGRQLSTEVVGPQIHPPHDADNERVTVRERDTMAQERLPIEDLVGFLRERL